MLPFDAHNHVHMGPADPLLPLENVSGMAVMSTHPRDFFRVESLSHQHPRQIVPCFGVHPWFLHEAGEQSDWMEDIQRYLEENPKAIVGEIGLDGFHFDAETKALTSPMEQQVEAFTQQLQLATDLNRPVSIHSVKSFGPLLSILSKQALPPKLYFHAFGGKVGTVNQILSLCKKQDVYFGFAPIVNFRSPKTPAVLRKIGIERLLLETDHEDARLVANSMRVGMQYIAEALDVSEATLIETTTNNAKKFYGLEDTK